MKTSLKTLTTLCLVFTTVARDRLYEFAFIAAPLKLRGANGAPMRPLALPVRKQ